MSGNLTQPTDVDPHEFIAAIDHAGRRADAEAMLAMMQRVTGWTPRMWGPSIIGFGRYRYRLASGREEQSLATGFSPRSTVLVLYTGAGSDVLADELAVLGRHRVGKSCLYVNRLHDVDLAVLESIVRRGLDVLRSRHDVIGD